MFGWAIGSRVGGEETILGLLKFLSSSGVMKMYYFVASSPNKISVYCFNL